MSATAVIIIITARKCMLLAYIAGIVGDSGWNVYCDYFGLS